MAKEKLTEYSAKRSFQATPEPAPAAGEARKGPLLFVIQQHSARRMHYDFRLECDGVLKSWAVPKGPSPDPAEKRLAVQTEDHPLAYATFEGVIPPGQYGAGEVIVWDCGVYSPDEGGHWFHDRAEAERQVREGLEKGKLSLLLRGEKVKGSYALVRTKEQKNWLLIKHKDRFAAKADLTAQDRSVLTNISVEEMKAMPAHRLPLERLVPTGEPARAAREPRADAGRAGRGGFQSSRLDVGAQARRLPGARVHRRQGGAASLAARARARQGFSAARRRARKTVGQRDGARRRDRGLRRKRQAVLQRAAEPFAADGFLLLRSASISRASICASLPTPTGAATSRSACCRRRWCSSYMPPTTAWPCTTQRWRAASKA